MEMSQLDGNDFRAVYKVMSSGLRPLKLAIYLSVYTGK